MKIKTQFIITMALFAAIMLGVSISAIVTIQKADTAVRQENIALSIVQGATELGYLSNDYLIYRESQQLTRWESRFASFSSQVATLEADAPEQQALLRSIQANQQRMRTVFEGIVANAQLRADNSAAGMSFLQVSWSQMAVQTQGLASDASRLSHLMREEAEWLQRLNLIIILALTGAFAAYFAINFWLIQRRTLSSLARLQAGTAIVGSGNLDFTIDEKHNDEVGDLSRAFNRMTGDLKTVTASKQDLEREVMERKKAEEMANVQKMTQDAINKILGGYMKFDTEELLADYSLQVAADVTQSQLGFIGRIGADGLLHDIAMMDLAWKACTIYDKTGHRRPPGNFRIAGLYGLVLTDGKSVLTNDPSVHAISIGTPKGHPELNSFLGVPLYHAGKVTGLVALANREGGYRPQDQQTLEALAPAIVETSMRKRAEQLIKQRTSELEVSNKELEAFSYSVSHDLRAPLRSMEGFSVALLEDCGDKLDDQGKMYLKAIQESSELMGRLMDDLLKLSRVSRSEMNVEDTDLGQLAAGIFAELQRSEPQRQVITSIAPGMVVKGDRNLLYLVLQNLLGNSWKFTSRTASPRIEIGVNGGSASPVYFVKDNGAGFDMSYADKLFKPFQRLHPLHEFSGTGIGLATVQRIVMRHGGRVWAEAKPGAGATFYFTLG